MHRLPLDVALLRSVVNQEMVIFRALLGQINMPEDVINTFTELSTLLNIQDNNNQSQSRKPEMIQGNMGRPKYVVCPQELQSLIEMSLPVPCIADILGVSTRTVRRRLDDNRLSIKQLYSNISDEQLDNLVRSVKARHPHLGYRMIHGILRGIGHRLQWKRVASSVKRVDPVGVVSRLTAMGCVARRTYSVPGPLHLVHIDTNHKLIR